MRGTLDVSVLGQKKSMPFELTGDARDGRQDRVTMISHLEPVNPGDARWLTADGSPRSSGS